MEYDLELLNFFTNDNTLNKIEMKLSIEYLRCKIDHCYSIKKNLKQQEQSPITRITHEDFETCKEKCLNSSKLNKLNMMKGFLYGDFTKFYYEKFLSCANESEEKKVNLCIEETKKQMKKNVDDVKKTMLNYKF